MTNDSARVDYIYYSRHILYSIYHIPITLIRNRLAEESSMYNLKKIDTIKNNNNCTNDFKNAASVSEKFEI